MHEDLVSLIREEHRASEDDVPLFCNRCGGVWPCLAAEAADAIEGMELAGKFFTEGRTFDTEIALHVERVSKLIVENRHLRRLLEQVLDPHEEPVELFREIQMALGKSG